MKMTIAEKIEYLWSQAYTDALGAGHPEPDAYANRKADEFSAGLIARDRRDMKREMAGA